MFNKIKAIWKKFAEPTPQYTFCVATDFATVIGAGLISQGKNSGEFFYQTKLRPSFTQAIQHHHKLMIVLDGTTGYSTSFLVASFGALGREFGSKKVLKTLLFKSDEEPYLVEEIIGYIKGEYLP
jgi:hypothetical protein